MHGEYNIKFMKMSCIYQWNVTATQGKWTYLKQKKKTEINNLNISNCPCICYYLLESN